MTRILRQQSLKLLLVIIAVLLAANLVVQVLTIATPTRAINPVTAANGIPDSGAQLQAVIDQLEGVNKRLDTMETFLEGGTMTVNAKVVKDDKDNK